MIIFITAIYIFFYWYTKIFLHLKRIHNYTLKHLYDLCCQIILTSWLISVLVSVFSHSCCDFSNCWYDGWFWLYLGCLRYCSGSYFIFFLADNLLLKFSMKARWWCMLPILSAHFLLYSFQSLSLLCSVQAFLVAKGRTRKEWGYSILVESADLSFFNTQKLPSRTWLSTRHATNPSLCPHL